MTTFRCSRFPTGLASINTAKGIVEFRNGLTEVESDEVAEALRAVPDVFGVYEYHGDAVPEGDDAVPVRPATSAGKDQWAAYAVATLSISPGQAKAMTKDRLIELTP